MKISSSHSGGVSWPQRNCFSDISLMLANKKKTSNSFEALLLLCIPPTDEKKSVMEVLVQGTVCAKLCNNNLPLIKE